MWLSGLGIALGPTTLPTQSTFPARLPQLCPRPRAGRTPGEAGRLWPRTGERPPTPGACSGCGGSRDAHLWVECHVLAMTPGE